MNANSTTGFPVAGTLHASTSQMAQMMKIADLSMQVWRANEAVDNAKHRYHRSISTYEAAHGCLGKFLRKDNPEHEAARAFTAPQYMALQQSKRRVYGLKVRLAKACASLARISAETVPTGST